MRRKFYVQSGAMWWITLAEEPLEACVDVCIAHEEKFGQVQAGHIFSVNTEHYITRENQQVSPKDLVILPTEEVREAYFQRLEGGAV
jgi:hypothetical protein